MGISLVGMYFMLKNDEFEGDKRVEKYHLILKQAYMFGYF